MGVANPGELLHGLVRQFHHFKQESKSTAAASSRGRRHEQELAALEAQFETLLLRWVGDGETRARWRDYFHHFGSRPPAIELAEPPLFKGAAGAGHEAALRSGTDGACEVVVDGKVTKRVPSTVSLSERRLRALHIEGIDFEERFDASGEALEALERYVRDPAAGVPWDCARELYEDGLIDPNFGLTARGKRLIDRRRNGGGGIDLSL